MLARDDWQCRALKAACAATSTAEHVHHSPPLRDLWNSGRDPFNEKYLFSVCARCHTRLDAARRRGDKFLVLCLGSCGLRSATWSVAGPSTLYKLRRLG